MHSWIRPCLGVSHTWPKRSYDLLQELLNPPLQTQTKAEERQPLKATGTQQGSTGMRSRLVRMSQVIVWLHDA